MNLYIGNLSYNVKESDLRNVMEEYGTVASVKLITDRETRRSKGFAFIEMPDDTEANNAIKQLNGAEYVGRSMDIQPKNKERRVGDNRHAFLIMLFLFMRYREHSLNYRFS